MRSSTSRSVLLVFACLCTSPLAFAWGSATHAYIDERLSKKGPILTVNQIYGGMGPDVFNYMFESPAEMAYLSNATHCNPLALWRVALLPTAKAQAYGFVSHNNLWGADYFAHAPACPSYLVPTEGYIFTKGAELEAIVKESPYGSLLAALNLPPQLEVAIFQDLAEFGVDILVKRLDPAIGQRVTSAALLRSPEFPLLLVLAYARGLSVNSGMRYEDAAKMIAAEEAQFRQTIIAYGQALMQDDATAIQLISQQMAQLAQSLLAANGITPPPVEDLVPILNFSISQAVTLCEGDYAPTLHSTINGVQEGLAAHRVSY